MAKSRIRYIDAPARNDVYVGMLGLAAFAGLIGVLVFCLELNEYDWASEAKATPAPPLPKMNAEPEKASGGDRPVPPVPAPPVPDPGM